MNQPLIHRQRINEGFQHRPRRTDRRRHINVAKAAVVRNIRRTHPAADFHIRVIDHDHRQRTARRQARFPVQRQILKLPLESGIEGRHHLFITTARQRPTGEERRQLRHLARKQPHRLLHRLLYRLLRPDALTDHTRKHFIARRLGPLRPAVRT